ncbi:MAG: ATP-binding cassette domain-containing protein [Proteobacteria bacterium]|nr:ATP-binding cassette domain-containing protein [Pseudomonadota bacterium]NIS69828.1 ATP-binding cassette domain-containing protein [Pseudomonadota bacterium]
MKVLETKNLVSGYGETDILHDVSIELKEKEIVSIIGPNGAGKSTLLKTIFGLLRPRGGVVELIGAEVTGLSPDRIVRKGMSYVPQVDNVFPSLTIQENLEMGAFIRTDDYGDKLEEVYELFPLLQERKNDKVGKLSGGQRQMIAMGRALMLDPRVLLLDEPSASLAPILVGMIFEKIIDINKTGVAIMVVEQNARETLKISDRGYVLAMGRKVFEDTGKAILENKEVGKLYLGG